MLAATNNQQKWTIRPTKPQKMDCCNEMPFLLTNTDERGVNAKKHQKHKYLVNLRQQQNKVTEENKKKVKMIVAIFATSFRPAKKTNV